mmetsp:Transcript_14687/g.33751  ORF Transcript_14687/g.33751 Transcript_14687/m.33751 type:complete len:417 (-) Transcript_14687:36-1286(-)
MHGHPRREIVMGCHGTESSKARNPQLLHSFQGVLFQSVPVLHVLAGQRRIAAGIPADELDFFRRRAIQKELHHLPQIRRRRRDRKEDDPRQALRKIPFQDDRNGPDEGEEGPGGRIGPSLPAPDVDGHHQCLCRVLVQPALEVEGEGQGPRFFGCHREIHHCREDLQDFSTGPVERAAAVAEGNDPRHLREGGRGFRRRREGPVRRDPPFPLGCVVVVVVVVAPDGVRICVFQRSGGFADSNSVPTAFVVRGYWQVFGPPVQIGPELFRSQGGIPVPGGHKTLSLGGGRFRTVPRELGKTIGQQRRGGSSKRSSHRQRRGVHCTVLSKSLSFSCSLADGATIALASNECGAMMRREGSVSLALSFLQNADSAWNSSRTEVVWEHHRLPTNTLCSGSWSWSWSWQQCEWGGEKKQQQ